MKTVNGICTSAKIFTDSIEEYALAQIKMLCDNEAFRGSKIRIMPDVHPGKVGTIGFTATVGERILPNVVGIDIGCGVTIAKLKQKKIEYQKLDAVIRDHVPSGYAVRKKAHRFKDRIDLGELYCCRHINESKADMSLGTLGGGNHFIEIGNSINNDYFITIHSGSRNFGTMVCEYHVRKNKKRIEEAKDFLNSVNDAIDKTTKEYNEYNEIVRSGDYIYGKAMFDYCIDMVIAQYYAKTNREAMLNIITNALNVKTENTFSSIHNFIDFEDFIIRKGAIRSYKGEKMIIPFNMRDGILICEGKSNEDWNFSAPHGAGRVLSRMQARKQIDMKDFIESMKGIYSSSISKNTLDEAPQAYKDSKEIETLIEPTANIIDRLRPVLNIKAS